MSPPAAAPRLTPLSSVRYLAAMHLFLFHLWASRAMGGAPGAPPPWPVFDVAPAWFVTWVERGYCSTSLFFMLSGFVLAYLYLDERGSSTVGARAFWWARFTRLYPLHIALLMLLAPLAVWFVGMLPATTFFTIPIPAGLYLAIGFALTATLTQAWFPEFALAWNFPTWALSTVAFFYVVFPWVGPRVASWRRPTQWLALGVAPLISLIPPAVYLSLAGDDVPMSMGSEFVGRTPLFWLPHFVMGILVARLAGVARSNPLPPAIPSGRPSWGDACALIVLVVTASAPDRVWAETLGVTPGWIRAGLRHGLLAPLYMVMLRDWALGVGWSSRALSLSWLARLGDSSFSIFMLQLPLMVATGIGYSVVPIEPYSQLAIALVLMSLIALTSTRIELWLMRRLRARGAGAP